MTASLNHKRPERGAALIIVLLLVATLSFIVLGLAAAMTRSVQRTAAGAARGDLLWRVVSLETLARAAFREAAERSEENNVTLTAEHPLFAADIDLPTSDGGGAMRFVDATRCFNLNSLVQGEDEERGVNEDAVEEFVEIAKAAGLNASDAETIAHVAADWIDEDSIQEIGGAEDGFYTNLPTPFRTGGGPLAAVSELRAMEGVGPERFAALAPYLCAHPTNEPAQININMLRRRDAPLLVGLTGGALSMVVAEEVIAARPPGGWESVEAFWAQKALADADISPETRQARTADASRYLEVFGEASVNEIDMAVRLFFESRAESGEITLISREIGAAG